MYQHCQYICADEKEEIMAKTATIQTRVDPVIKNNAQMILKKLNISMYPMTFEDHLGFLLFRQFKSSYNPVDSPPCPFF